MQLEQEQRTYEREREALKRTGARWVLIKGDHVLEVFSEYAPAIHAGYNRFGLEPFMVNAIQDEDYFISVPSYTVITEDIAPEDFSH